MKQKIHQELTRLVATTLPLNQEQLNYLLSASIEPDVSKKQQLEQKKSFKVPFSWFIEHSAKARDFAVLTIKIAKKNKSQKKDWLRPLGWAYHFITDLGTPYHSLTSKVNQIPSLTEIGKRIGSYAIDYSKNLAVDIFTTIAGMGILSTVGANIIKKRHDEFEKICDYQWKYVNKKRLHYAFMHSRFIPSLSMDIALDALQNYCNTIDKRWIHTCSIKEFEDHLICIAQVMDLATQYVIQ